jgi:hypothetical protein
VQRRRLALADAIEVFEAGLSLEEVIERLGRRGGHGAATGVQYFDPDVPYLERQRRDQAAAWEAREASEQRLNVPHVRTDAIPPAYDRRQPGVMERQREAEIEYSKAPRDEHGRLPPRPPRIRDGVMASDPAEPIRDPRRDRR